MQWQDENLELARYEAILFGLAGCLNNLNTSVHIGLHRAAENLTKAPSHMAIHSIADFRHLLGGKQPMSVLAALSNGTIFVFLYIWLLIRRNNVVQGD